MKEHLLFPESGFQIKDCDYRKKVGWFRGQ